jgi:hypothetical protein
MWARMWGKWTHHTLLVGMLISIITMENSMEGTQKLKLELPYDPAILLLGYTQKNVSQVTMKTPAHLCLLQHYSQ